MNAYSEKEKKYNSLEDKVNMLDRIIRSLSQRVNDLELAKDNVKEIYVSGIKVPQKCPLCDGGKLLGKNYHSLGAQEMELDISCKPCNSTGIVWG